MPIVNVKYPRAASVQSQKTREIRFWLILSAERETEYQVQDTGTSTAADKREICQFNPMSFDPFDHWKFQAGEEVRFCYIRYHRPQQLLENAVFRAKAEEPSTEEGAGG